LGKWKMGKANRLKLDHDVTRKTASLTVDVKSVAKERPLKPLGRCICASSAMAPRPEPRWTTSR
jgi:hypothetical protein